jgi:hypothetical protein
MAEIAVFFVNAVISVAAALRSPEYRRGIGAFAGVWRKCTTYELTAVLGIGGKFLFNSTL